jgi:hypothetical protein
MFALEFINEPLIDYGEPAIRGRITLGDFWEEFTAPLVYWSQDDYRRQWSEAADSNVRGCERTCFVQAMRKSPGDGPIFLWTAYRSGDIVYVQQKLLVEQTLKAEFDPVDPYAQVDERMIISEVGWPISEWVISIADIALFLQRAG